MAPIWPGSNHDLGSTWSEESTNFAVWAPEATAAYLCLVDDDGTETRHRLTERIARHLARRGARHPSRASATATGSPGPWAPEQGLRFNPQKLLLDPYARAVSGELVQDPAIFGYTVDAPESRDFLDSAGKVPLSVVVDDRFDWGDDRPARRRWRDTVIYELHVKGMTQLHDRVPEELRGTYAGLATPAVIDYLCDLGVTAVELLPMHQFVTEPEVAARGLTNYWGYNSIGFFAPHAAYSSSGDRGEQVTEFKAMVKAFHDAGLEVILDVVYNHTAEAGVDRADAVLPRAGRQDLPPGAAGAGRSTAFARHLLGRDRLRQHRRRQPPVRAADDPRLAALLGDRDARRRLPVRPALRAHPDRPGAWTCAATCWWPSARTRCCGTSS